MDSRKVAIITGAGSGVGRATSRLFARHGWSVVLVGRREEALRSTAEEIEADASGGRTGGPAASGTPKLVCRRGDPTSGTLIVPADIERPGEAFRVVDEAVGRFGRVDVIVNNAGFGRLVSLGETDEQTLRRSFEVNAIAPALAVLRAWPVFEKQRGGCVVNVASMSIVDPFAGFFAYAASKGALNVMAKSIAKEGSAIGVRAFCIAPGAVETPMLRTLFDESAIPPESCLSPEQVGAVILDCAQGRHDTHAGGTICVVREGAGARTWVL